MATPWRKSFRRTLVCVTCAGWTTGAWRSRGMIWANTRIRPSTRRNVNKQQEAETEGGEQARETRAVVEGFGNHRFRNHREQCSGSKCLQPRWPRLAERTERDIPGRD